MPDLDGKVYELMGPSGRTKSPVSDKGVKEMIAQIRGHEAHIAVLEEKSPKSGGFARLRKSKKA
jgi:hypothetical protein